MRVVSALLLFVFAVPVGASETITYTYDAKGRVMSVVHSGTVNNGLQSDYTFDKVDNRTRKKTGPAAAPPSFAIAAGSAVTEGAPLTFIVTKTGTTSSSFSVNYATSGGTATAGSDYTATSGTLTFAASDTNKSISVTTIDDSSVEPAETVQVTISAPTGGSTITTASATGTINDNDTAPNNPPVANTDGFSVAHCAAKTGVNLTSNDTDPDGDYPITIVALSGPGAAYAQIMTSSTIDFYAPSASGSYPITYTISDSRGAQATGTVNVTVTGSGACQ